jgi:hypothetical protein
MTAPTLGELVDVADVDTVVRLDGAGGRLAELVLTGDVIGSLSEVLAAAAAPTGAGFFVVGPFGSGKSHFLAAVGELLDDPESAQRLTGWDARLRDLAGAAHRCVAVRVPLVEYRAAASLEDVVAERAWRALGRPREPSGADRLVAWGTFFKAALAEGRHGVVFLLDELSEFLRAKRGPALTEDLRFLQFLGEWARDRPVVVLAALQESIEEVANVSQRELGRIRDRYRPSLTLSMRHVEDLVRGRLVRLRPGAAEWVDRAWKEMSSAFPTAGPTRERFERCYPLHPDALGVLEGLRFLLSQQRGVVDFMCRRLATSLDRPYTSLITPDEVFDHFRGRLHERHETAPFADVIVPYFERAAGELVDTGDEELAVRAVKLLCLLAGSPRERDRTAAELAWMLLARVSDLDPAANAAYLDQAILRPLADSGAYVVAKAGGVYTVELGADAAAVARTRVAQARAELSPGDRRIVSTLVELGSAPTLPLKLIFEIGWARRQVMWQNTQRSVTVGSGRVLELGPEDAQQLTGQARASSAEGCLLISEVELDDPVEAQQRASALAAGNPRLAIWVPDGLTAGEVDAALDIRSRRLASDALRAEGRADVVEVLSRQTESDAAQAREILRRLYFAGRLVHGGTVGDGPDLASLSGLPFDRQLAALTGPLLAALHPRHAEVMPRRELVGERLVGELVTEVIGPGRLGPAAVAHHSLRSLIDGFLVPLGLVRVRADGARLAPDPARSPAVAEAVRLAGEGDAVPAVEVIRGLADGPVGLTEPEAILVLNACVQAGLLEMWRGRGQMAEPFTAVTPRDRLGPGELVEPAVRALVEKLGPIAGPGPLEPWTAAVQRTVWGHARVWLQARLEDLGAARAGLERLGDIPALAGVDPGPVLEDVAVVGAVLDACTPGPGQELPAPAALRQLVAAVDDPEALLGAAKRLAAVAQFFRDGLRRVEEAAGYLTHPELTIRRDQEALAGLHVKAVGMLEATLRLAAGDRTGEVLAAAREFRGAYLAAYEEGHDRYYAAVSPADVDAIRAEPVYRDLAALAGIGAVAVPDDRVKVDRMLAGATPAPCRRRVEVELGWKPLCACGYALGDREPVLDREVVLTVARRGVDEYLEELAKPDLTLRIEDAAGDLDNLGRAELAGAVRQLVAIARATCGGDGAHREPGAVAQVLDRDVAAVVGDVLTGGQLIVIRDLALLREDLIGRRYPKRKLLEILAGWVDATGDIAPGGFVEIVDSSEPPLGPGAAATPGFAGPSRAGGPGGTAAMLADRFPGLAALLPGHQAADAFWLAAWWGDRPAPPTWLPARLLTDPTRLAAAAEAISGDLLARTELVDLDARIGPDTVLGRQVAAALDLPARPAADVAAVVSGERLLRHPARLGVEELLHRVTADWQLAPLLETVATLPAHHALLSEAEVAAAVHLADAARNLAALERSISDTTLPALVSDLYPRLYAPVPELISRAALAAGAGTFLSTEILDAFRDAAARLLRRADTEFESHGLGAFPGCQRIWEVGENVVRSLLERHHRIAVLLVDAMRADLSVRVVEMIGEMLAGRVARRSWAVVPAPTRTVESVAAMHLGRPVPAGSETAPPGAPFAHLGYETAVLVGADRDDCAGELRALWESGPPISVAVATGVDERLHRTSVELAGLLDEAATALRRRVVPSLAAVPETVPLVVIADHGFRENPAWGRGPEGRYVHGAVSLEECVVPVVVFAPAQERLRLSSSS